MAALLARRRPSDRQGRRPLPRRLLAGVPDVGGHRRCPRRSTATASCSAAARRCRRASAMSSIRSRWPKRFGVDALRYFLMREVTFGQDGSYSAEAIVNRVNAELANSFGNLAQRTLSMIFKNLDGVLPAAGEAAEDAGLARKGRRMPAPSLTDAFERLRLLGRARGLDGRGVRLQRLCRRAGAVGAAQDRSGAHGGGARRRSSPRFASSPRRLRRSFRRRPTSC